MLAGSSPTPAAAISAGGMEETVTAVSAPITSNSPGMVGLLVAVSAVSVVGAAVGSLATAVAAVSPPVNPNRSPNEMGGKNSPTSTNAATITKPMMMNFDDFPDPFAVSWPVSGVGSTADIAPVSCISPDACSSSILLYTSITDRGDSCRIGPV